MTQSVELVLDEGLDALVRADWDALAAAGLPSQARHRSPSNRPHVTLAARAAIDEALEPAMALAPGEFPLALRLGALSVFGRDRFVLVRAVVRRRRAAAPAGRARDRPGQRRRPAVHAGGSLGAARDPRPPHDPGAGGARPVGAARAAGGRRVRRGGAPLGRRRAP